MTDSPILFSAPMVRALLDGRKFQTRRIIKHQPPANVTSAGVISRSTEGQTDEWTWLSGDPRDCDTWGVEGDFKTGFRPDDRLWVKEAWRFINMTTEPSGRHYLCVGYEADGPDLPNRPMIEVPQEVIDKIHARKRDIWLCREQRARFMFRVLSRLTLLVDDVKVERLQDISEADAIAEGIERIDDPRGTCWKSYETYADGSPHPHAAVPNRSPVTSFRELWNSLHGANAWDANPWLVVPTFRVVRGNIDRIPA